MTTRARFIVVLMALAVMLVISAMNLDVRIWRDHPGPFGCVPTGAHRC